MNPLRRYTKSWVYEGTFFLGEKNPFSFCSQRGQWSLRGKKIRITAMQTSPLNLRSGDEAFLNPKYLILKAETKSVFYPKRILCFLCYLLRCIASKNTLNSFLCFLPPSLPSVGPESTLLILSQNHHCTHSNNNFSIPHWRTVWELTSVQFSTSCMDLGAKWTWKVKLTKRTLENKSDWSRNVYIANKSLMNLYN